MVELKYQVIFLYSIYVILNIPEFVIPLIKKYMLMKKTHYLNMVHDENYTDDKIIKAKVAAEF